MQIKPKNFLHHQKIQLLVLFLVFAGTSLMGFILVPGRVDAAISVSQPCVSFTGDYKTACRDEVKKCTKPAPGVSLRESGYNTCVLTAARKIAATTPQSICALKILKSDCLAEAKECPNQSCIGRLATKFKDVRTICRDENPPQTCHETITKELKKCAEGPGGAVRESCEIGARLAGTVEEPKGLTQDDKISIAAKGEKAYKCGNTDDSVMTQINLGCQGDKLKEPTGPIQDMLYAFIRFLSFGVGLIMAASIIYAGLQYTASEGNAEASQASKTRIKNALVGLVFYIVIWAFIQYLVPGGLFQ